MTTPHNKNKIIAAAMQAGLAFDSEEFPEIWQTYMHVGRAEIERFWQIAFEAGRQAEREALAASPEQSLARVRNQYPYPIFPADVPEPTGGPVIRAMKGREREQP